MRCRKSLGSQRFGTSYRYRGVDGRLDGDKLPVDLAANAASLGADVIRVATAAEFGDAVKVAKASDRTTVIHVETDPLIPRRTASPGGTCPSARCQRWSPPGPPTGGMPTGSPSNGRSSDPPTARRI